ncbi:hypothetical protein RHOFW510R12_00520 [Rhodanobacter sp. FW510-R12]
MAAAVVATSAMVYPLARDRLADYRANKALLSSMDGMRPGGDSWEAFTALQAQERRVMQATGAKAPSAQERVTDQERKWLLSALGQGNLVAAASLFPDPLRQDDPIYAPQRFQAIRKQAAERVLTAAEAALGRRGDAAYSDRWMLHAAANINALGVDRPRNPAQAAMLYEAAFEAGDTLAALGAAAMAKELGRKEDAYRWALRCLGPCQTPGFDLSVYQAGLSLQAITRVQRSAAP